MNMISRFCGAVGRSAFALGLALAMAAPSQAGLVFDDENAPALADILGKTLKYESIARIKYEAGEARASMDIYDEYRETGEIFLDKENTGLIGKVRHHNYSSDRQISILLDGNLRNGEFNGLAEEPYRVAIRGKITFAAGRLIVEWPAAHPFRRTEFRFSKAKSGIRCDLTDQLVASEEDKAVLEIEGQTYRYHLPKSFVKSECTLGAR